MLLIGLACRSPGRVPDTGRVDVGNSYLHFERTGVGPALVFVHGGQMDSRLWDPQVERFARDHHVIRYDVRGYGRSGPVQAPYASHEDLHVLAEALDLPSFTLVGHSLGGRIALDYVLDHPERVDALVLVAPGVTGWDWSGPEHEFFAGISAAAQAGDTARAVELWLACPYMAPAMERSELAPLLRTLASANERAWTIPPVERRRQPPALAHLDRIDTPTLLIVGDRDVPDILRIADRLEREIRGLQRVDLSGVGHVPNLEDGERLDAALQRFLEEVAGGAAGREW